MCIHKINRPCQSVATNGTANATIIYPLINVLQLFNLIGAIKSLRSYWTKSQLNGVCANLILTVLELFQDEFTVVIIKQSGSLFGRIVYV